jgi:hypothetical protein
MVPTKSDRWITSSVDCRSIEILPLELVVLVRSYVGRLLDLEVPFAER